MDNFLQLYAQYEKSLTDKDGNDDTPTLKEYSIDINHLKGVWQEISAEYEQTRDFDKVLGNLEKKEKSMKT